MGVNWTSETDKKWMLSKAKAAGVLIMGSKTFNPDSKHLHERKNIVMTHHPEKYGTYTNTTFTSRAPEAILAGLKKEGYKEACIFGGRQIFKLFLEGNLVDELWITQTPHVFTSGIKFPFESISKEPKIISTRKLGKHEMLSQQTLRY